MKTIICCGIIACVAALGGCSKGTSSARDDGSGLEPLVLEKVEPVVPEPPSEQSESQERIHVVQKGDTFWKIAQQYYGDGKKYPMIMEANGINDVHNLKIGQKLVIP